MTSSHGALIRIQKAWNSGDSACKELQSLAKMNAMTRFRLSKPDSSISGQWDVPTTHKTNLKQVESHPSNRNVIKTHVPHKLCATKVNDIPSLTMVTNRHHPERHEHCDYVHVFYSALQTRNQRIRRKNPSTKQRRPKWSC